MTHVSDDETFFYSELPPLTLGSEIEVSLIKVIDYNHTIIEISNDSIDSNTFTQISHEMQELAKEQPILLNPSVDQPCIALYSEDLMWYRAQVVNLIDERTVCVWFVDFGNMEVVLKENIRRIRKAWMRYPILQYPAKISNIRLANNSLAKKVVEFLEAFVFTVQLARIESLEPIEVTLIDKKTRKLLYERLIKSGALQFI